MDQKPYQIGLIGCGTVGAGVLELLHRRREVFSGLLGRPIEVNKVAVRDVEKTRHKFTALWSRMYSPPISVR